MENFKEEFVTEYLNSNSIAEALEKIVKDAYVAGFEKAESIELEEMQRI